MKFLKRFKKAIPKRVTKWKVTVYFMCGEFLHYTELLFDSWVRAETVAEKLLNEKGAYNHDTLGEYNDISVQKRDFRPVPDNLIEECIYLPADADVKCVLLREEIVYEKESTE
jgi:hypothetical protein